MRSLSSSTGVLAVTRLHPPVERLLLFILQASNQHHNT
jgi:hypothetical protein